MPARRATVRRTPNAITPEAVEAFKAAEALKPIRDACDDGRLCKSPDPGRRHCDDCRAYTEASQQLSRALGLSPWEVSPLWANDGPSPWGPGTGGYISWPQAQRLRAELIAAAKEHDSRQR